MTKKIEIKDDIIQVWVWLAIKSRIENVPLLTSQVGVSTQMYEG